MGAKVQQIFGMCKFWARKWKIFGENIQILFGCNRRNHGMVCRGIDIEGADKIRRQGTNMTASQAGQLTKETKNARGLIPRAKEILCNLD